MSGSQERRREDERKQRTISSVYDILEVSNEEYEYGWKYEYTSKNA